MRLRQEVGVLEVLAVDVRQIEQAGEVERGGQPEDLPLRDVQLAGEQLQQLVRDGLLDLQTHRRASDLAAQQLLLQGEQEVLGVVLLDLHVLVAGDAEDARAGHLHAAEQLGQVLDDDLLERDEPRGGQPDEAVEDARHLDAGELASLVGRVAQQHADVERQARDVREGVRGVDGQRREHRVDALGEELVHAGPLVGGELAPAQQVDALGPQRRQDLVLEERGLRGDQLVDAGEHRVVELARPHTGDRGDGHAGVDAALEAGDADHEELVEVGAEDRRELGAFQQRDAPGVAGQVENAVVEGQPAQLALGVAVLRQLVGPVLGRRGPLRGAPIRGAVHRFCSWSASAGTRA